MGEYCSNCGFNKALCEVFTNLLGDPCVKETDGMQIELKELRDGYDYITARCTDLAVELHVMESELAEARRERDRLREAMTEISYDPWDAADIAKAALEGKP
jgi:hypothetical protein